VLEPAEERDDVAAAQCPGIAAVIIAVQAEAGRQFPGPVHVILQDRGGVVAAPGGQFLGDPAFEGLAEPGLRDAGEVDDPAAAVAEHDGVPDVLALLVLGRCPGSQHRLLQVVGQRPVMAGEPGGVEAGDRRCAGAQQPAADDPQLVEVGQCPLTAAFLQAEQDLGLDQRGQAPQDDLVAAGDRSARLAPGTEVGRRECSRAVLLPPADVVRAAQSPPGMCLPGADHDPARAEAGQRLRPRVLQEVRQRKPELLAAMLMGVTQPQLSRTDRTRAPLRRADDLTAMPGAHGSGSDELPCAQVASPAGALTGRAKPVWHQPLASAAPDEADPVSQQRMIR
jgi:hypothetical protein